MRLPRRVERSRALSRILATLRFAPLLITIPALSAAPAAPDALLPRPVPADRYQALAARSPFSPPTVEVPRPVQAPTPPPPGWGDKFTLGGLAQFGAGYKVTLNPKNPVGAGTTASAGGNNVNPTERIIVISGEPNSDGIVLAGVQWGDDAKQTRATLVKNGVPAVFNFDPTALTTARGNAATAASVPAPRSSASTPGITPPVNGFVPPPPFPGATPNPGIVRSPNNRAPIRPPPPATGPNGTPLLAPPPSAPVRTNSPRSAPGNAADDDD